MKRSVITSSVGAILSLGLLVSGCELDETSSGTDGMVTGSGGKTSSGGGSATGGSTGTAKNGGSPALGGATSSGGSGGGTTPGSGGVAAGGAKSGGSTLIGSGGSPAGGAKTGGTAGETPAQGGVSGGAPSGGSTPPPGGSTPLPDAYKKPRIIATTDGEVDDRSTMVRFLMYASDFDVKGIVQVNSRYQKNGHSKEKWVEKEIELYGQTLKNLKVHNPDYPDASQLLSVVKVGNETQADLFVAPSSMSTKETPGSKHIMDNVLDDDPRPIHIPSWGGANTTAYALFTMKNSLPADKVSAAASKMWVYCIWYQDNGGEWIENNIPEVNIYEAYRWDNVWDYQSLSANNNPPEVKATMTSAWLNANVKTGHGPLGAYTPQSYVSEGDTPSFLALINNGLYQHADYTWGGWGGRPKRDKGRHMTDKGVTSDDGNEYKSFWRWIIDLEWDFAGRMDWAVTESYAGANHNPKAEVVGGLVREVAGGSTVTLDGSPTTDPDGNNMTFKWWQYFEAGTASKVTITNDTAKTGATFTVPSEPGKQIHIIFEVKDDGKPVMPNYQRIIFNIK